jgi:hypothetical protein
MTVKILMIYGLSLSGPIIKISLVQAAFASTKNKTSSSDYTTNCSTAELKGMLMARTIKDMRKFAEDRGIMLSPSKIKTEEEKFIRRLPKVIYTYV